MGISTESSDIEVAAPEPRAMNAEDVRVWERVVVEVLDRHPEVRNEICETLDRRLGRP